MAVAASGYAFLEDLVVALRRSREELLQVVQLSYQRGQARFDVKDHPNGTIIRATRKHSLKHIHMQGEEPPSQSERTACKGGVSRSGFGEPAPPPPWNNMPSSSSSHPPGVPPPLPRHDDGYIPAPPPPRNVGGARAPMQPPPPAKSSASASSSATTPVNNGTPAVNDLQLTIAQKEREIAALKAQVEKKNQTSAPIRLVKAIMTAQANFDASNFGSEYLDMHVGDVFEQMEHSQQGQGWCYVRPIVQDNGSSKFADREGWVPEQYLAQHLGEFPARQNGSMDDDYNHFVEQQLHTSPVHNGTTKPTLIDWLAPPPLIHNPKAPQVYSIEDEPEASPAYGGISAASSAHACAAVAAATFDASGYDSEYISIREGETVTRLGAEDGGWAHIRNCTGSTGWVPATYIEDKCEAGSPDTSSAKKAEWL